MVHLIGLKKKLATVMVSKNKLDLFGSSLKNGNSLKIIKLISFIEIQIQIQKNTISDKNHFQHLILNVKDLTK